MNHEDNPFKDEKLQTVKHKALELSKTGQGVPSSVIDWLILKVQPNITIEKVYINLAVGGKADSNFSFNLYEYFVHIFPSFSSILESSKKFSSINSDRSSQITSINYQRKFMKNQEKIVCEKMKHGLKPQLSLHKSEKSPTKVDISSRITNQLSKSESSELLFSLKQGNDKFFSKSPPSQGFQGSIKRIKTIMLTRSTSSLFGSFDFIQSISQKQKKIYLGSPRMNTTYSEFMKYKFAKGY